MMYFYIFGPSHGINNETCRITAQILGPFTHQTFGEGPPLQDLDLVMGLSRSQYTSFTWSDMSAVAPWMMEENITKRIDGPGLGN
jgi:hypothetical protein